MTSQQWVKILTPLLNKDIALVFVGGEERGILKKIEEHVITLHRPARTYDHLRSFAGETEQPDPRTSTEPVILEIIVAVQSIHAVSYLESDKA